LSEYARVTKRLRDKDGLQTASDNPILQKRMFEVEYPDGHKASLAANAIVETMFAQGDDEANRNVSFDAIVDHRTDGSEMWQQDSPITLALKPNVRKRRRKGMKESYPLQLAEYTVQNRVSGEPILRGACAKRPHSMSPSA
jgi:hypothetical protein